MSDENQEQYPEPDFEALCDDLPISISAYPDGNQVMIYDFKSHEEGEGNAKEALNRIEKVAFEANFDTVTMNIGRLGGNTDVISWLENRGFEVVNRLVTPDHVTAHKKLENPMQ